MPLLPAIRPPRARRFGRALALAASAAIALGACSDLVVPIEDAATTTYAPTLDVDLGASRRTASGLYIEDVITGSGAVADSGRTLSVYYAGWLTNGRQFDSNRGATTPFQFQLGVSPIIRGWTEGLAGMRVGGRRRLVIPPALAYGTTSQARIPAGSVLVFEIDLVNVTGGATGTTTSTSSTSGGR